MIDDSTNLVRDQIELRTGLRSHIITRQERAPSIGAEELEEERVGVPDTRVRHRAVERPTEAENLTQRQRHGAPEWWITVQVPDHEFAQQVDLLDRLPCCKTALGSHGSKELRGAIPQRCDLFAVRPEHERKKSNQELRETLDDLVYTLAGSYRLGAA